LSLNISFVKVLAEIAFSVGCTMHIEYENSLEKKPGQEMALQELQDSIGYQFKNLEYLKEAITHKSYANEIQLENPYGNERLEFIGDAVLGLIVSHILMDRGKNCSEGRLSNMRAAIVNEDVLSSLARSFNIGSYILLSKGEHECGGREKKSILANVYEALIAAIYFDSGFSATFSIIQRHCSALLDEVIQKGFFRDYKSRLQEHAQRTLNAVPRYVLTMEDGPDHEKFFESQVIIGNCVYEKGQGGSKKISEQDAAEKTLNFLLSEGS
jgi:ribonuclease III